MAKRKIIKIDEAKCNGCGQCVSACHEGALKMVKGKAKLVADNYCDGLGACIGDCPQGAITIVERDAAPFVGPAPAACSCPGAAMQDFSDQGESEGEGAGAQRSQLRQWPVQLHLVPPLAPYFMGKDVILAADCVAFALGNFHQDYLKGKSLAIACPKLDEGQEAYVEKITAMIDEAKINTLTVMTMEVPCCGGLLQVAKEGAKLAKRKIPLKVIVVSLQGKILKEEWV
ncbi:MAG: 4Fe-4S binding protein [bacterium]